MGYTSPYLSVRKVAGGWTMSPPDSATTDYLKILSNEIDTEPSITLIGAGNIQYNVPSANSHVFYTNGTARVYIFRDGDGVSIQAAGGDDNIFLRPNGTGYVRFGTKTATGDVAINGHLDIKDAANNVVKLATVA